jgi:hypothetical protein
VHGRRPRIRQGARGILGTGEMRPGIWSPVAKNPVSSRGGNPSMLWRLIMCLVCFVLCRETGPRGFRVESYRREVDSFGVPVMLIMIEDVILLRKSCLGLPQVLHRRTGAVRKARKPRMPKNGISHLIPGFTVRLGMSRDSRYLCKHGLRHAFSLAPDN